MQLITLPTIYSGATWRVKLTWRNPNGTLVNLTGCSALLQVRDASSVLLIELSSGNGRISFDALNGLIYLLITAIDSSSLQFTFAKFDLVITMSNGDIMRLFGGNISALPLISHGS